MLCAGPNQNKPTFDREFRWQFFLTANWAIGQPRDELRARLSMRWASRGDMLATRIADLAGTHPPREQSLSDWADRCGEWAERGGGTDFAPLPWEHDQSALSRIFNSVARSAIIAAVDPWTARREVSR